MWTGISGELEDSAGLEERGFKRGAEVDQEVVLKRLGMVGKESYLEHSPVPLLSPP